jgi:hypothetical protein
MTDNERLRAHVVKLLARVTIPPEQECNAQFSVGFLAAKSQMLRFAAAEANSAPIKATPEPEDLCNWVWKRSAWHTQCGRRIETSRSTKCPCGRNFRIG